MRGTIKKRVREWLDALDLIEKFLFRLALLVTFAIELAKFLKAQF